MWFWILIISIPIIILAILEETIQFIVNRKIFGKSEKQFKLKENFRHVKNKFVHKKSPSQ
ncbi:hypothetical protein J7I93_14055 [Bacillus sp. ISL-47]|uniref:hypothetical protein n=1 Tax=Bacillus sp. ISL-47 TaxID=2819130 RepID=UPI001BE9AD36|nr:hypothetical protein [Bacillus sp. ISL-47]MBT2689312.1 hypothetical protein [Bacillus sp. ISL-47]